MWETKISQLYKQKGKLKVSKRRNFIKESRIIKGRRMCQVIQITEIRNQIRQKTYMALYQEQILLMIFWNHLNPNKNALVLVLEVRLEDLVNKSLNFTKRYTVIIFKMHFLMFKKWQCRKLILIPTYLPSQ